MERWKTILGGRYSVSDQGRIYSFIREKILSPHKKGNGYWSLSLGKDTHYYVHRLVAENFVGKCRGREVNHKNGDKDDNRACNLEWVTHRTNILHAHRLGLMVRQVGEDASAVKLTAEEVGEIRRRYKRWMGGKLGREFGVTATTILTIVKRKTWKHI